MTEQRVQFIPPPPTSVQQVQFVLPADAVIDTSTTDDVTSPSRKKKRVEAAPKPKIPFMAALDFEAANGTSVSGARSPKVVLAVSPTVTARRLVAPPGPGAAAVPLPRGAPPMALLTSASATTPAAISTPVATHHQAGTSHGGAPLQGSGRTPRASVPSPRSASGVSPTLVHKIQRRIRVVLATLTRTPGATASGASSGYVSFKDLEQGVGQRYGRTVQEVSGCGLGVAHFLEDMGDVLVMDVEKKCALKGRSALEAALALLREEEKEEEAGQVDKGLRLGHGAASVASGVGRVHAGGSAAV